MKRILLLVVLGLMALAWHSGSGYAFSLEDTEFKGDLRLRWDYYHKEDTSEMTSLQRHRARGRLRFGFETKMHERVMIGVRIVTGDSDPRSTNQTLANFFATKDARLDLAFARYKATGDLSFLFGKFNKAFFVVDDLLWDSDISFEGMSLLWKRVGEGGYGGFFNGGLFVLNEDKNSSEDPHMFYLQPGFTYKPNGNASFDIAVKYYGFEHVKGMEPSEDFSSGTNTTEDGRLIYNYDSINSNFVFKYGPGISDAAAHVLVIFGDYIYNSDSKDSGYLAGAKFGSPKVGKKSTWILIYSFRRLERDAWLDVFPDSDFYGGGTNVSGHEFIAQFAIAKNIILAVDYYNARKIEGDEDPLNLLQLDCIFKF